MATRNVGTWNNGLVSIDLTYDSSNRITGITVTNNSEQTVFVEAKQESNGRKYNSIFLPHTTTTYPVGTGASQRIDQFWDATRQRWDGISLEVLIPAP